MSAKASSRTGSVHDLKEIEKTVKDKSRVAINTGFFTGLIVSILLI